MHFKINMTLISILIIVSFFSIPFYNNWMNTNLLNPNLKFSVMYKNMDIEQRKISRFGYSYIVYKEMSKIFKQAKIDSPLVLLPPDAYLKANNIKDIAIVEPAIFYYFTGEKAVWYNSEGVEKANCALVPDPRTKIMLKKIGNPEELNALITEYKKYKID
jgi:hypothetical protein